MFRLFKKKKALISFSSNDTITIGMEDNETGKIKYFDFGVCRQCGHVISINNTRKITIIKEDLIREDKTFSMRMCNNCLKGYNIFKVDMFGELIPMKEKNEKTISTKRSHRSGKSSKAKTNKK